MNENLSGPSYLFLEGSLHGILVGRHGLEGGMAESEPLADLRVKDGEEQDRHNVLDEERERRVGGPSVSERPFLVADNMVF